jgi:hypothetical protein
LKNQERRFCASFCFGLRRSLGLCFTNTGAALASLSKPKICCKLSIPDYFNSLLERHVNERFDREAEAVDQKVEDNGNRNP